MAKKTKKDTVKTETKAEAVVESTKGKTPDEPILTDNKANPGDAQDVKTENEKDELEAKIAEGVVKPKAEVSEEVPVELTEEELAKQAELEAAELAEAKALIERRNELRAKEKELKKRKSTAATKVKRGQTRSASLQSELDKVLGNQTAEQLKAEIFELEAGLESLKFETRVTEAEAEQIKMANAEIEAKLRVAEGKTAVPKPKKKSGKPRVVNTQAIQKSALVRALETRGWVMEKAEGEENVDRVISEDLGATVALMDGFAILDMDELDKPVRVEFGKGAILNIEDAIAAA